MRNEPHIPSTLDQMSAAIRDQPLDPAVAAAAADRVRLAIRAEGNVADGNRTADDPIRGCSDVQAMLPAYLRQNLDSSHLLLIEDHTGSCVPCRRALKTLRDGNREAVVAPAVSRLRFPRAIAAALVVAMLGVSTWLLTGLYAMDGEVATVETINGTMFASGDRPEAVSVGNRVGANDEVRTAKGSGAVLRLHDGSLIEMADRTALSVGRRRGGTTIQLARGNIIVQAAKQRDGHLYVATRDCLVAVKGTIFSVNNGTKGSRVSVIEGSVEVNYGGGETKLAPGQQVSTHSSMAAVPLRREIAWSRDGDRYLAMMNEIADIGREIQANVAPPPPRASSRLLDLVPSGTAVYAAMPNVGRSVSDAYAIFRARMEQSEVLRSWWQEGRHGAETAQIDETIGYLRDLGEHLGEEVVFALRMSTAGDPRGLILMAEAPNPSQLRDFLRDALGRWSRTGDQVPFQVVSDPTTVDDARSLLLWVRDDGLLLAGQQEDLLAIATGDASLPRFAETPFHHRIETAYRDGVHWLFAADLHTIFASCLGSSNPAQQRSLATWEKMGLTDLDHIVIEERTVDGVSHKQAVLAFDEPRRGLTSWLASPAPMSSLEFISPDAAMAGAFVVKDPKSMLDDLLDVLATVEPDIPEQVAKLEREHGIHLRDDLAAPLGGEVAFALDGPVLPEPSWKILIEVYDPTRLTATISTLVERVAHADETPIELTQAQHDGRPFYGIRRGGLDLPVHWTIVDGFLIAGPSEAILANAIRYRDSGVTLARSRILTDLFPQDGHTNFSALAFHNMQNLLSTAAGLVQTRINMTDAQKAAVADWTSGMSAELYYGYGEPDRITFSGSGRGGLFGMDIGTLIRLNGILGLDRMFGQDSSGRDSPAYE